MAWPAGYTILPLLPAGTYAVANAVSDDGSVVVGEADNPAAHAVYWTNDAGPVDLGFLPGGTYTIGKAANSDGSVIVGYGDATDGNDHAWRWTAAGGMAQLPEPPGSTFAYAYGISADGSVIVGEFGDPSFNDHACYWLNSAAPVDIGVLSGGTFAWANAASSDGSVIVGISQTTGGLQRAFRWTQAGGMVDLDPGGPTSSAARAVSSDGAVAVGSIVAGNDHAFRWTLGGGLVNLGTLPGGSLGRAFSVSGDGSLVVGTGDNSDGTQVPWQWTAAAGMVALPAAAGASLTSSSDGFGVAANRSVIVGDVPIDQTPPPPPDYVVTPVLLNTPNASTDQLLWPSGTIFASPQSTGVMSVWIYGGTHEFLWVADDDGLGLGGMSFSVFSGSVGMSISDTLGRGMDASASWSAIITDNPCTLHVLVSYDLPGQHLQIYVNDTLIVDTHAVATAPVWPGGARAWAAGIMYETPSVIDPGFQYYSDFWCGLTSGFVDLTNVTNRRKFINADLTAVYLGTTGQNPFGTSPQVYQIVPSGGAASDWQFNRGTSGGTFALTGDATLQLAGNPCTPTYPPVYHAFVYGFGVLPGAAELLDLYLAPTDGFVDLRAQSERRKFIALDSATQYLGPDGSYPFGRAPPVFLTLDAGKPVEHFADNDGAGGAFSVTGGPLANGTTRPPCGTYWVPADVLPNVPQGADPQVMLSVSDDGGWTFSLLQKWRSMGKLGEYEKRLRWMKLGQFRNRQIRLEITDPVRRNIIGVYVDVSQGIE